MSIQYKYLPIGGLYKKIIFNKKSFRFLRKIKFVGWCKNSIAVTPGMGYLGKL